jgi:CyaY protein
MSLMDEKQYRHLVDQAFAAIDAAFADIDPDLAESLVAQGSLTVIFPGGRKLIVSPQTPVRQIWVAFKDRAWHLDHDAASGRWLDDRGQGTELYALVETITREATGGVAVRVAPAAH